MKIEEKQKAGKVLQAEEIELLTTKPSVERSIMDIKTLKEQLEDIAKQIASEQAAGVEEEEMPQIAEPVPAPVVPEPVPVPEPVSTEVQCVVEEKVASTMTDSDEGMRKLLKALHVYAR